MISHARLREIVAALKYPNFTFELAEADFFPDYIGRVVVHTMAPEVYDYLAGVPEPHMGPIASSFSVHFEESETGVVRQAFQAVRTIITHEAGEFFQYGDERPFNPHLRKSLETTNMLDKLKTYGQSLDMLISDDLGESR